MDSYNPYLPPSAPLGVAVPASELPPASRVQRFANFLIDTLCYYVLIFLVAVVYGVFLAVTDPEAAQRGEGVSTLMSYVLAIGSMLFYYVVSESLTGRTVGKLVTGTRVVREDGEPLTFGTVFKRNLARLIPFEPFSFFGGGGEAPRGWHDTISDTVVVRTR
jgi:uncharacterized RDD family membrane protein YckC